MRITELDLPDEDLGVYAISSVDMPAIESNFIALSKRQKKSQYQMAKSDKDKMILIGAALIPDKMIYRNDGDDEGYYIYFPKKVVQKAAYLYQKNSMQSNHTHQHERRVDGVYVAESWIVEDPEMDKSKHYGLSVPKGTWMVTMKVDNKEFWEKYVKSGEVKGFSIEAMFSEKMRKQSVARNSVDSTIEECLSLIEKIKKETK